MDSAPTRMTEGRLDADPTTCGGRARSRRAVRLAKARKTFRHSTASYRAALLNLALQSALLAMSLVSIDGAANCVPPWLAIVLAVGGIFLLAVISQATGYAVRLFEEK